MLNNQFIVSKSSGFIVGGFPISKLSTDVRFKDLVVPFGLYKGPIKMYNAISEHSSASVIDVDTFDTLLNNVSVTRKMSKKTTLKKR